MLHAMHLPFSVLRAQHIPWLTQPCQGLSWVWTSWLCPLKPQIKGFEGTGSTGHCLHGVRHSVLLLGAMQATVSWTVQVLLNGNKCMVVGPGGGQGPTAGQHLGSLPSSGVQAASLMSPGLNT